MDEIDSMGMIEKMTGIKIPKMPSCDVCNQNLVAGAITFNTEKGPLTICMKCVFVAVDYWLKSREERMKG